MSETDIRLQDMIEKRDIAPETSRDIENMEKLLVCPICCLSG